MSTPAANVSTNTIDRIDHARTRVGVLRDRAERGEFGQFMTPKGVAQFMAGLFDTPHQSIRLLDAGAGLGSLAAAFVDQWSNKISASNAAIKVTAYEIDSNISAHLKTNFSSLRNSQSNCEFQIINEDFIETAVNNIQFGVGKRFTHAILNPPYRKISSVSRHRHLLRSVGIETVNLYTAFVALAVALMEQGGEVVAIIPRSFCNGLYYQPFRQWLFAHAALTHIHLFESRTSAFSDDKVLQENVIIKLRCGVQQQSVVVSTSTDATFADLNQREVTASEVIVPGDNAKFIHVPSVRSNQLQSSLPIATQTLAQLGLNVATGPVVDFRLKEHLRSEPDGITAPLLYATHFSSGELEWPKLGKKPNAIAINATTRKWLMPVGFYTVVKRFSSKEERRRIVASVVEPDKLPSAEIGFENHLNVFHANKGGLSAEIAYGLATYLNSSSVDEWFRLFSGHTQVNATDLRRMSYPTTEQLIAIGRWARGVGIPAQQAIDEQLIQYGNTNA